MPAGISVSGSVSANTDNFGLVGSGNSISLYYGNGWSNGGGSLTVSGSAVSGMVECNTGVWTAGIAGDKITVSCNGPGGSITFSSSARADLTAGSVWPTSVFTGVSTSLSALITNTGSFSTGRGFWNLFQIANADPIDPSVEIRNYGDSTTTTGLTPGGIAVASLFRTFSSPGTYYIRVCADKSTANSAGVIRESNEGNNCGVWTSIIASNPPIVNGSCAATHYACTTGTSASNVDGTSAYTWSCVGSNGGTSASCSEAKAPVATLSASPSSVAYNGRSTLTWSSTNATSCTAGGPWSTSGNLSGSGLTDPLIADTSFTFQCTGPGGTSPLVSATVTVAPPTCGNGANNYPACNTCSDPLVWVSSSSSCVACSNGGCSGGVCRNGANNPPACNLYKPVASLSANPASVDVGQSSTLTWNSTNDATSCVGTGFTAGPAGGTRSTGVFDTPGTRDYQVVCTGPGGTSQPAFTSVQVLSPDVFIRADRTRVRSGETSNISWGASGVKSCIVSDPASPPYLASGNADNGNNFTKDSPYPATITSQSKFTIVCKTNGADITRSVTVNVLPSFQEF